MEWFSHCTIDMVNKMLTGKRSYSMTAYFNTISDEKSDHQSARVEDSDFHNSLFFTILRSIF
jgi:hypothetical protein